MLKGATYLLDVQDKIFDRILLCNPFYAGKTPTLVEVCNLFDAIDKLPNSTCFLQPIWRHRCRSGSYLIILFIRHECKIALMTLTRQPSSRYRTYRKMLKAKYSNYQSNSIFVTLGYSGSQLYLAEKSETFIRVNME